MLIEYAINNSRLLAPIEYFFKCTGKTYVRNFPDIADAISYIVTRPRHVAVNEMLIRPTEQQR